MSLTKDDLLAIKNIVDEASEDIKIDVAAGFDEVHEKIDRVHSELDSKIDEVSNKLDVKDGKLDNTVQRVDQHGSDIKKLQQKLA